MSRIITALSLVLTMIFISGCGNGKKNEPAVGENQQQIVQNDENKNQQQGGKPSENQAKKPEQNASKNDTAQQQKTAPEVSKQNQQQADAAPDFELRRTIQSIMRLERSEMPLTKEQANKLISLLEDIKGKETIEKEYADKKNIEIKAVLTDKQKEAINARPEGMRQGGQNTGERPVRDNNMGDRKPPQDNAGNNMRPDGNRGGFGGDLKSLCERVIETLKAVGTGA